MGWDVVGKLGAAASWVHDKTETTIDEAGHAVDRAVHDAEQVIDDGRKAIVDLGDHHGGIVGQAVAHDLSNGIGLVEGAGLAVYDAAAGIATLARGLQHLGSPVEWALHPERNTARAQAAGNALTTMAKLGSPTAWLLHPRENSNAATALWNGVTVGYRDAAQSGDWSKFAGRAVVDVGSFFIGAGEVNAAIKGTEGANAAVHAAEGLNAASHAAEGLNGAVHAAEGLQAAARAGDGLSDAARAAEGLNDAARTVEGLTDATRTAESLNGTSRGGRAAAATAEAEDATAARLALIEPTWFKDLSWSEPVKVETLRADRTLIPKESGVYVFTNYSGPLERNTGVLYVGKAKTLNSRLASYLADPREMLLLSQKSGEARVSSSLRHAGKAQLLVEIQQRYHVPGNADSGIFVRWVTRSEPKSLEDRLIEYLQPAFNTRGR